MQNTNVPEGQQARVKNASQSVGYVPVGQQYPPANIDVPSGQTFAPDESGEAFRATPPVVARLEKPAN